MTDTGVKTAMTDQEAQALLQRALGHLQQNQALEAEAIFATILKAHPANPDALQLLGVLRRSQGRMDEAEALYRQSLAAKPDQPQVHHNLGNLLKALGRDDEAIAAQREAIRLKPNYAEAYLNLASVLAEKEELAEAEKIIRRALHIKPNWLLAKQVLGAILNDAGKLKEAEAVLLQALSASKDARQTAALEHNLGVTMSHQNRYGEALTLFDKAQAAVPEMPHVDYNRANALQAIGQLDAAVEFYRRAVTRDPLDMNAHSDLNTLLYRLGEDERILRSYDDAFALYPEAGGLPLAKATFLFNKQDFDRARAEYERALQALPDLAKPHDGLALVYARKGDFDAAIREHEIAVAKDAEQGEYWRNFGDTLSRAGDAKKALAVLRRALEIDPHDQAALAFSSVAMRQLGDPRDEVINDYERFVQVFELAPPEGYSDIEAFNRDLNSALDALHDSRREFVDQSIRGGTQTMFNLFGRGHELVERLRRRIDETVTSYISGLGEHAEHPFLARRSAKFGYSGSWSSRLRDCGFHDNHYHHKGWISSAYYIDLPGAVSDTTKKEGWLKFGEPPFDAGIQDPVRRIVQPIAGRLVLFPSYMWHGTIPFHSSQARTSLAFDAVPK
jgi:tetratricopeptide (TPR) repeat protein